MANKPFDEDAAEDFSTRFRHIHERWQQEHGPLPDDTLTKELYAKYKVDVNRESIRKMRHGLINPRTLTIELLVALTKYLECTPAELGPVVEERLEHLTMLVWGRRPPRKAPGKRGPNSDGEQDFRSSPWSDEVALARARRQLRVIPGTRSA